MLPRAGTGWRADAYDAKERYEAWQQKLNNVYNSWELVGFGSTKFHAELYHHSVSNIQFVSCVCDPCGAVRRKKNVAQDNNEMLAIQLVISGRENFRIEDKEIVLGPGDILIWNTLRPMSFEIVEKLQKISVMVPLSRLRNWLPSSWHSVRSVLPSGSRPANIIKSFIISVSPDFLSGAIQHGEALTETMIGMLVSALSIESTIKDQYSLRDYHLFRVKQYIDMSLADPELSPCMIAAANRISIRYLHSLFEVEGTTVQQYVIKERLARCYRELANPLMAHRTITDIAFSWGFRNSTHFSRRFKEMYGLSPQEFRNEARPGW